MIEDCPRRGEIEKFIGTAVPIIFIITYLQGGTAVIDIDPWRQKAIIVKLLPDNSPHDDIHWTCTTDGKRTDGGRLRSVATHIYNHA